MKTLRNTYLLLSWDSPLSDFRDCALAWSCLLISADTLSFTPTVSNALFGTADFLTVQVIEKREWRHYVIPTRCYLGIRHLVAR